MTAWASLTDARRYWPESVTVPDDTLAELLASSTERLAAYAPALLLGEAVPTRYAHANVLDARDLYAARLVTGADGDPQLLAEGYAVRLRRGPSQQVRELLRPTRPAVAR